MKNLCLVISIVLWLFASDIAQAKSTGDPRLQTIAYQPDHIVTLKGNFGYQTEIEFSKGETIQLVSAGDAEAWTVTTADHSVFIKPKAFSHTNMTIVTNQRHYQFELMTEPKADKPIFRIRFIYPEERTTKQPSIEDVKTTHPEQLNCQYSYAGDESQVPLEVFNDNQFTYFKFKHDGMSSLPAIFIVDSDRSETVVNYHHDGDYLVVNRVGKQFTLRNGQHVTSIFNDRAIGDWQDVVKE